MAEEIERAYLIVTCKGEGIAENLGMPKTIDLRVVLNDSRNEKDFLTAINLEYSKLRKKHHSHEIRRIYADLPSFCREFPVAAAKYIEDKATVEAKVSEILKEIS